MHTYSCRLQLHVHTRKIRPSWRREDSREPNVLNTQRIGTHRTVRSTATTNKGVPRRMNFMAGAAFLVKKSRSIGKKTVHLQTIALVSCPACARTSLSRCSNCNHQITTLSMECAESCNSEIGGCLFGIYFILLVHIWQRGRQT